jgi:DNA-binding NtrC family response regulator
MTTSQDSRHTLLLNTPQLSSKPGLPRLIGVPFTRAIARLAKGEFRVPNSFERLRVLVADDDCVIANTLTQILRLSGYEAETVNSGEEAVAVAAKRRPDVLISDVVMGGITGIESAIRILEMVPGCLVILISGQANQLDSVRRMGHEFEILSKPVHPKVLLEQIAAFALKRTSAEMHRGVQADACC